MALVSSIGSFDQSVEEWTAYVERVELYLAANVIDNAERRRAVLLSVCGASTYQLIRSLVAPAKPTDKTFAEIAKLVKEHLTPTPSCTMLRYKFNARSQSEKEPVCEFVAALRHLAENCEFGQSLDDMLRDRLVCGLRDTRVQRRLLAEPKLTFAKALELAQAAELAEEGARILQPQVNSQEAGSVLSLSKQPSPTDDPVFALSPSKPKPFRSMGRCYRCGGQHSEASCRCKDWTCNSCGKQGHIAKVCRSRARNAQPGFQKQNRLPATPGGRSTNNDSHVNTVFLARNSSNPPISVVMNVNGANIPMEVDTGAAASLISEATYKGSWASLVKPPLKRADVSLHTYSGEVLPVVGQISVTVKFQDQKQELSLLVVRGVGPSLLGRDWFRKLKMDLAKLSVFQVSTSSSLQAVLSKYSELFRDELGLVKGVKIKLYVDSSQQPRFFKPRSVPFALRERVEAELDRLHKAGVIEPVQFSEWAAPIVPVVKGDGSIRICGDYKLTINSVACTESYPLPRIEDLLASINNGRIFSKLDLSNAFQQLELDDDSKRLVTISTQRGLYQYNRLPFGISSAPAIFQRTMETLLRDIPNVCVYIDDVLVSGTSEGEHLKTLESVLAKLQRSGLRLKMSKCVFMVSSVEYLGHVISADGVHPTEQKRQAIVNAPAPQDVGQLRSFLGLLTYYSKFLPHLASTLSPLYSLLEKQRSWSWGRAQQSAFLQAKQLLISADVLTHFDPQKKLLLSCDASPYGVGAVLSHEMEDGSDRPIAYASRTLSPAEKKYAQLEKEGLAVVFGVTKFHQFLLGREFTILSDHKPLQYLFSENRGIPPMASARIQRWSLTLSAYRYHIKFRAGKQMGNADALSRLPVVESSTEGAESNETVLMVEALENCGSPITTASVKAWTDRDPILNRVRNTVIHGNWRTLVNEPMFQPYTSRKLELSTKDGCVLLGSRIVVPEAGREVVLRILHEAHPGIVRMKGLARGVVWWPGIDKDLEATVKSCNACQANRKSPPVAPLHPWEFPSRPWSRLHIDFAGPFLGKMFVVLIDAYTKWLEVAIVPSCSAQQTIKFLRYVFATHGIPEQLVSDNGSTFCSEEFQSFLNRNGIKHSKTAPYHPSSNGLAERSVQTLKEALTKSTGDLDMRLARFLFAYRLTPHSTTGRSPAELLFGRKPRSVLDIFGPDSDLADKVAQHQHRQKLNHDRHAKSRTFHLGDHVFVRNFRSTPEWLPGIVRSWIGPLSVRVQLEDGREWRRHLDHIRVRFDVSSDPVSVQEETQAPRSELTSSQESAAPVAASLTEFFPDLQVIPVEGASNAQIINAPVVEKAITPENNLPTVDRSETSTRAQQGNTERQDNAASCATSTSNDGNLSIPLSNTDIPPRRSSRRRNPTEFYGT